MDWISSLSLFISSAAIVGLAVMDPKRNRALRGRTSITWLRRGLLLALVAPGVVLILQGRVATVLVWVGVASIAGWIAAWLVNHSHPKRD